MRRFLNNDLNIKDENRLVNATSKLTDEQATRYTFDDNVSPVMIAGIEENQTDSSVDLISVIRDYNGVNRLTVDTSGLPVQSGGQTLFNATLTALGLTNAYTPNVVEGKILYIKNVLFSNGDSAAHVLDIVKTSKTGRGSGTNNYCYCIVPPLSSLLISDLNIDIYPGDFLTINTTVAGWDNIYMYGFYQ